MGLNLAFPPLPPTIDIENLNHNFKPLTMDIMREMIYSEDSELNSMKVKRYKGEITSVIENMLESMYKLTVLATTMKKFSEINVLSHVQPYLDDKQQFRCYLSPSYIVVEVAPDPDINGNWRHIIENHGADEKGKKRYYEFSIIPNLSDETHEKINEGITMVIETVEKHIFDIMNKTNTIFEQVNMIRIGNKTADEIKHEEWLRHAERKKIKDKEKAEQKESRSKFWGKLLKISPKITFS